MKPIVDNRCDLETILKRQALMIVLLDYERNEATIFSNAIHLLEKLKRTKIHKENLDVWISYIGGECDGQSTQINQYFKGYNFGHTPLAVVNKMAEFERYAYNADAEAEADENEYGLSGDWWK